jgi:hypothetical protein
VAGLDGVGDPEDGDPEDVREPIADSWRRSYAAGVDPIANRMAPVVADEDETQALWHEHPLARAAPVIHECLEAIADETSHLVVITDASGVLLSVEGSARLRRRAADHMNFAEGTLWSEPGAGTNAISTAIAANHAVQAGALQRGPGAAVVADLASAQPVQDDSEHPPPGLGLDVGRRAEHGLDQLQVGLVDVGP